MSAKIGATIGLDGEKEFKQAISGINSDLKVLASELNKASAEFSDNANSIGALTSKGDILNRQLEKQKEKVDALRLALENSTKQYGENDTRTDKWKTSLNNAEAELSKLDKELKTNDKYIGEAKSSTDGMARSIDSFGKEVKTASDKTLGFGDVLKANLASDVIISGVRALGNGLKDVAKGTVNLVTDTAAYADEMLTLSTQTGVSTGKLQAYNYMAELTDTSLETLTGSMAKNIKSMTNAQSGSEKYTEAYKKLKVQWDDGNGKLRDSEKVYWDVIDALKGITDETERDSIAMQLFGKSAQDLNPLIEQGSEGVAKFTKEAEKMGAVLDEKTLSALGETDDAFQRMTEASNIAKRTFAAEVAPAITEAAQKITSELTNMDGELVGMAEGGIQAVSDGLVWVIDNSDIVIAGLTGIGAAMITEAAATGIMSAVSAFKTLSVSIKAAAVSQEAFNLAQNANAIGLIVSAVAGLTAAGIAYSKMQDTASDGLKKITKQVEDTTDSCEDLISKVNGTSKAFEETTEEINTSSKASEQLADKLYDLAEKENKSNSEKAQMKSLVDQLNNTIPGLNLVLSEQTGILSKQKDEVDGLIRSYKDKAMAQAYEERYFELTKEQISLQQELTIATETENAAQLTANDANEKASAIAEKNLGLGTSLNSNLAVEITERAKCNEQYETAKTNVKNLNDKLTENATKLQETEKNMGGTTDATESYADSVGNATIQINESMDELVKAYSDAKNAATDSIQSQIDIFGELEKKSAEDLEKMGDNLLKNLTDQAKNVSEWADNLDSLSEKGINEGLLKHLEEMGPSAAQEIAALNTLTAKELIEYNKQWEELGIATEKGAVTTTRELQNTYSDAYKKQQFNALAAGEAMIQSHNKGVKNEAELAGATLSNTLHGAITTADTNSKVAANTAGKNVVGGIKQGISDSESKLYDKVIAVAENLLSKFNQSIDAHSPSRKFKKSGGYIADGVIEGIESKKENLKKSASEMGEILLSAANTKLVNYKVYNDMTLKEEVEFWNKIRKELKKGTQARIDADKEYYDSKKALQASQKSVEKEYNDNVIQTNTELVESIDKVTKSYEDAVESRTEAITDSMNLFDKFSLGPSATGADLLDNLKTQVDGLEDWKANLEALQKRGIDGGLIEELQNMGPKASGEIATLNTLTDSQLTEYVNLWKEKSELAKEEAVSELVELKEETVEQIKDLRVNAKKELNEYKNVYVKGMSDLGVEVLVKAKVIGENIANGIVSGMKSQQGYVLKSAANMADAALSAAKIGASLSGISSVTSGINNEISGTVSTGAGNQATYSSVDMAALLNQFNILTSAVKNISGDVILNLGNEDVARANKLGTLSLERRFEITTA